MNALTDIRNAVLSLQSADYNTYQRPLRELAAALDSDELRSINDALKAEVDFDAFEGQERAGGMVGSDVLDWPSDKAKMLGLTLILIERGAANPDWLTDFAHTFYYGGGKYSADLRKLVTSAIVPFERDYRTYVEARAKPQKQASPGEFDTTKVFIVHGHDEAAPVMVARFVEGLGFEAIILHEQRNKGRTIIEKLEAFSDVGFAIVLFTPDDVGRAVGDDVLHARARQNVVLELGYFIGKLGRGRVAAIRKGDVEWPSDYNGVVYLDLDAGGGWQRKLAEELDEAGYDIDFNKVMKGRGRRTA